MITTYTQKASTVQKVADSKAASLFDSSSQSESLQRKADLVNNAVQRAEPPRPNNTGMPDNLKSGIESLSGFSMDDVCVHYNSSKPATVQALAYTQGTDIHVAPGQEKHLPHEAWHVAQQMAGRVSPTTNINGMPVNDNAALEHEADVMGEKAVQRKGCEQLCLQQNKQTKIDCKQRMPETKDLIGYTCKEDSKNKGHVENESTIKLESPIYQGTDNPPKNRTMVNGEKVKALSAIAFEAGRLEKIIKDKFDKNEFLQAEIYANYKKRMSNETENLALTYRFGKKWSGYVVKVFKVCKRKEKSLKNAVMRDDSDEIVYKGDKEERFETYSNQHALTGKSSILEESYTKKTNPFCGIVPDAYTKLAGEGARFECVRRNISNLNDETVFYPTGQPSGQENGIKFSDLWKTWKINFDKEYNIPDKDISEKMRTNGNQLIMSNGGPSTSTKALPGNRVKLDGVSTIENEKNFDEELVKLSWKLKLDTLDMDTIQELEELEKNIVYKLNSREAIKKYCSLEEDERKKINGLESEKIEKVLALEKFQIKKFFAFKPNYINTISSLGKTQILAFLELNDDQRERIFDLNLSVDGITKILEHGGSIFELSDLSLNYIITFKSGVIEEIFRMKQNCENCNISQIIGALNNLTEEERERIFKIPSYPAIEKLLSFESETCRKILKFEPEPEIRVLFNLSEPCFNTLLALDIDKTKKILALNSIDIIEAFVKLKDTEYFFSLDQTAFAELIKSYWDFNTQSFLSKILNAALKDLKRGKNISKLCQERNVSC